VIGTTVKRKANKALFTVTGQSEDGWVLTPEPFGPPIEATAAVLRSDFAVKDAHEPMRDSEQAGWDRFGEAFRRTVLRSRRGVPRSLTPEEALTDAGASAARAIAAQIAADPDLRADFDIGLLTLHPAVERELEALTGARDAQR
jgi:hypothetical protein